MYPDTYRCMCVRNIYICVCVCVCVCTYLCVCVYLPTYLLTYLPTYLLTYLPTYLSSYLLPSLLTYLVLQPFFSLEPSAKPQPRLGTWPSCCLADRLQGALPHGFFVWFIGKWRSYISYIPMFLIEIMGTKMINQPSFFFGNPAFRPKPLEWSENEEPKSPSCWFCMDELLEWTLNCMLYAEVRARAGSPCSQVTYWAGFP